LQSAADPEHLAQVGLEITDTEPSVSTAGRFPHQRLPSRHALESDRQRQRDDRGQTLRNGGHGEAHRQQQHLRRLPAAQPLDESDRGDERQAHEQQHAAERVEATLERRGSRLDAAEHRSDASDLGTHARRGDERPPLAGGEQGAHVDHVRPVPEVGLRRQPRRGVLVDGLGFAGERGLLRAQAVRVQESRVRGRLVARLELDDVAGNELADVDPRDRPVAKDARGRPGEVSERAHGARGALLLGEAEEGIEDHDREDRDRVDALAQNEREHRGPEQQGDHQALELRRESRERGTPRRFLETVRAMAGTCLRDPSRGQAAFGIDLRLTEQVLGRPRVGRRVLRRRDRHATSVRMESRPPKSVGRALRCLADSIARRRCVTARRETGRAFVVPVVLSSHARGVSRTSFRCQEPLPTCQWLGSGSDSPDT
jgi:hypothetical protein